MRSFTGKVISLLVALLLLAGGIYWIATNPGILLPNSASTGSLPDTTVPLPSGSSTTPSPTVTKPTAPTTTPTTVPPTGTGHSHSFLPGWFFDDGFHWFACECGEIFDLEPHTDTDQDNMCDICNGYIPAEPHEHAFSAHWLSNETDHWRECDCGKKADLASHADGDVNGKCDICDADVPLPPHEHHFGNDWISDEFSHWHACDCGETADAAEHTDGDVNGKCDICDADVPLPHKHSFGAEWVFNETVHWHVCECGQETNPAIHIDNNFNGKCDVCDADVPVDPHDHNFSTTWKSDDTNHWHLCDCGEKADVAEHIDIDMNGKCDVCKKAVALPPHEHHFGTAWKSDKDKHWQVCACGETTGQAAHADTNNDHRCDVCAYIVSMPKAPKLNGTGAFIFDNKTNSYLYSSSQSMGNTVYPASITKLFTCYVALEYLSLEEEVLLGDEQSFVRWDASKAGFKVGETVTVEALLHGVLLPSGSDASYALAVAAGRKILNNPKADAASARDAFIGKMNDWAQRLGMGTTHFVTPDGIHDNEHAISFHAFVTIARCAMSKEAILTICGKTSATVVYKDKAGNECSLPLKNTNSLLHSGSEYYIPECVGLKTGFTNAAGRCFLGVFFYKGRCIIIATFGCSSDDTRWQDMEALWKYYLELEPLTE